MSGTPDCVNCGNPYNLHRRVGEHLLCPEGAGVYAETGEPKAVCFDCGLPYSDPGFADLVVAHEVWAKISPTGHDGGLLCPTCMVRAAVRAGVADVKAAFRSGPFSENAAALRSEPAPATGSSAPDMIEQEFACLTGDCPHETQVECDAWIREQLLTLARENRELRSTPLNAEPLNLAEPLRSEPPTSEELRERLDELAVAAGALERWKFASHMSDPLPGDITETNRRETVLAAARAEVERLFARAER